MGVEGAGAEGAEAGEGGLADAGVSAEYFVGAAGDCLAGAADECESVGAEALWSVPLGAWGTGGADAADVVVSWEADADFVVGVVGCVGAAGDALSVDQGESVEAEAGELGGDVDWLRGAGQALSGYVHEVLVALAAVGDGDGVVGADRDADGADEGVAGGAGAGFEGGVPDKADGAGDALAVVPVVVGVAGTVGSDRVVDWVGGAGDAGGRCAEVVAVVAGAGSHVPEAELWAYGAVGAVDKEGVVLANAGGAWEFHVGAAGGLVLAGVALVGLCGVAEVAGDVGDDSAPADAVVDGHAGGGAEGAGAGYAADGAASGEGQSVVDEGWGGDLSDSYVLVGWGGSWWGHESAEFECGSVEPNNVGEVEYFRECVLSEGDGEGDESFCGVGDGGVDFDGGDGGGGWA